MNKKRIIHIILVIEAIICAVVSICLRKNAADSIFDIMKAPFEGIGYLLRHMSLSGTAGNAIAIMIYIIICIMPIILCIRNLRVTKQEKKSGNKLVKKSEESLMVLLSVMLFVGIYFFINPSHISDIEGVITVEMFKYSVAITIYSMIILYGVIKLYKAFDRMKEDKLINSLKIICLIAMAVLVASIFFIGVEELLDNLETARKNNIYITNTYIILCFAFVVEYLPNVCVIIIISKLMDVAGEIARGYFTEEVLAEIGKISSICKRSVIIILASITSINIIQLLCTSVVSITKYVLVVPVFDIILIIVVLIITEMITESKKMKEYNDMFI